DPRQERAVPRDLVVATADPVVVLEALGVAPAPDVVDREVHDDPVEPGVEAALPFELADVAVDLDECVLHDVERVLLALHDTEGDGVRAPMVALEQGAEGRGVPRLNPPDQITVVAGLVT